MASRQRLFSFAKSGPTLNRWLIIVSLANSAAVLGQATAPRSRNEPTSMTAMNCEVQVGEFESACETEVELLDNKQASFLFVTVKSVPEAHEISFYTEHVGMLVIAVDDGMMVTTGDCKNNARRLRCRSDDRGAVLQVEWPR